MLPCIDRCLRRVTLGLSLALTAVLIASGSAYAVPIAYTVNVGSEPGFAYSYIHSASSGSTFKMGGSLLFELTGQITGSLDAGHLSLDTDIILDAAGIGGAFTGQDWSLAITGGDLFVYDGSAGTNPLGDPSPAIGFAGGSFNYTLSNDAGPESHSGTFYFFPRDFSGSPNTLSAALLALWGNNWHNFDDPLPSAGMDRLGIDIHADGAPVPEPHAALLYAVGVALCGATSRRRRPRTLR